MVSLSERQQHDLDKAVYDYLRSRNYTEASAAFKAECGLGDDPPDPRLEGLLEKKWVAVIRLQKKILELETKMGTLQEELKSAPASRNANLVDWIPKGGPRHSLTGHRATITRVAFHPIFSMIATASEDATIKIWDWETAQLERTLTGHTREVKDVDFHPQGTYLVSSSSDLTIRLWDTSAWDARGYTAQSMYGHDHTISTARFLHNGDFLVSASRDQTIKVWEVATKFCVRTIQAHDQWVRYVVPSSDDRLLVSCSTDHMARVWDYKTGSMKSEMRGHDQQVEVAVFAPTSAYPYIRQLTGASDNSNEPGQFVVTGSRDKQIMIWDTNSGQHLRTFIGHDGWVLGLEFHPSGKYLISVSDDKHMRIWDLASGRCSRDIEAHSHFVTCVSWGKATHGGGDPSKALTNGVNGAADPAKRRINVLATAGYDLSVNIWTP